MDGWKKERSCWCASDISPLLLIRIPTATSLSERRRRKKIKLSLPEKVIINVETGFFLNFEGFWYTRTWVWMANLRSLKRKKNKSISFFKKFSKPFNGFPKRKYKVKVPTIGQRSCFLLAILFYLRPSCIPFAKKKNVFILWSRLGARTFLLVGLYDRQVKRNEEIRKEVDERWV